MQIFEYSIKLGTGERISILEIDVAALDAWTSSAFKQHKARHAIAPVLKLCTMAPRQTMEDAKNGYTKPLENALRSPPDGCLMKLDKPVCANVKDCAMADAEKCTTKFNLLKNKFPECWDYAVAGHGNNGAGEDFDDSMAAAMEVAKAIVMAWRDGKHVIVVE